MKILFLIIGLDTGGAEIMLYKLLSRINREQFQPIIISLLNKGTLGDKFLELDIPVYCLEINKFNLLFAVTRLFNLINKLEPDLIQGWMSHGNIAGELINIFRVKKIPTLWNIRQSLYSLSYETKLTAIIIKLLAIFSSFPQAIIYNSKISCEQHQRLGYDHTKSLIIPNGFDPEIFKPSLGAKQKLCQELNLSPDLILIGLVARLHPMKDHENFLQAAKIITQKNSKINFILVGKNIDKNNSYLLNLINKLNLSHQVHLLGQRNDIPLINTAFDMATSSSYTEAFPNVVGEAMSSGVPCVVTDVGDSAWIVGDTGKVVPCKNPQALARAWQELMEMTPQQRQLLGEKARQRIIANFSLNSIVAQYENLYQSIYRN
jgi:glycosyltransferase involved in cell wall biosynthesis